MTEGIRLLVPTNDLTDEVLCQIADSRLARIRPLMDQFTLPTLGKVKVPINDRGSWIPIREATESPLCKTAGVFSTLHIKGPRLNNPDETWLYGIGRNGRWLLVRLHLNHDKLPAERVQSIDLATDGELSRNITATSICKSLGIKPEDILRFLDKTCSDFRDRLERKLRKIQQIQDDSQAENKIVDVIQGRQTVCP